MLHVQRHVMSSNTHTGSPPKLRLALLAQAFVYSLSLSLSLRRHCKHNNTNTNDIMIIMLILRLLILDHYYFGSSLEGSTRCGVVRIRAGAGREHPPLCARAPTAGRHEVEGQLLREHLRLSEVHKEGHMTTGRNVET